MRDLWSFFFYMLISGILRETFLYKSKLIVQQNDPNSEWFALCLKSFLYFWVFVCVCECDCATAYICISPPGDLYTAKAGLSSWTGPGSSRCDPYTQHTVREKQKHAGGAITYEYGVTSTDKPKKDVGWPVIEFSIVIRQKVSIHFLAQQLWPKSAVIQITALTFL